MGARLDDLLGELAVDPHADAPGGLEAAVWRQVDARDAAAHRMRSGLALQCAIGACALLVGFSFQSYQRSILAPPLDPSPSLRLIDGTTVADVGSFQVLR